MSSNAPDDSLHIQTAADAAAAAAQETAGQKKHTF
jgi:hypothetical protein